MKSGYLIAPLILTLSLASAYWIHHQNQSLLSEQTLNRELLLKVSNLEAQVEDLQNKRRDVVPQPVIENKNAGRDQALQLLMAQLQAAEKSRQELQQRKQKIREGKNPTDDLKAQLKVLQDNLASLSVDKTRDSEALKADDRKSKEAHDVERSARQQRSKQRFAQIKALQNFLNSSNIQISRLQRQVKNPNAWSEIQTLQDQQTQARAQMEELKKDEALDEINYQRAKTNFEMSERADKDDLHYSQSEIDKQSVALNAEIQKIKEQIVADHQSSLSQKEQLAQLDELIRQKNEEIQSLQAKINLLK
jgi:hypothetical protein